MLDSSFQPNFQESYSSFPISLIQNKQPSILKLSMKLRESEWHSQNMLDSHFSVPCFIYFFSRTSECKKIHPENEYGSIAWIRATIIKSDGLTSLPQFSKPTSILIVSRRTNCKEYRRHDSNSKFYYLAYQ